VKLHRVVQVTSPLSYAHAHGRNRGAAVTSPQRTSKEARHG